MLLATTWLVAAPAATLPDPFAVGARCLGAVCVGDTLHTARRQLPAGHRWRDGAQGADWLGPGGAVAARFVPEDKPAPTPAARRIAVIELRRAGSATGVAGVKLGDDAAPLQAAGGGGWSRPEEGLRWWAVKRPQAPGALPDPLGLGVDARQRVVRVVMSGNRQREAGFANLAAALVASRERWRRLDATRAAVPEPPPAALPPLAVYAELLWLPGLSTLRVTSRPDCSVAACQVLRLDVGGAALGPADGRGVVLPGGVAARFAPTRCGGSCSPASIAFLRLGQPVRLWFDPQFGQPGAKALPEDEVAGLLATMAETALR